MKILVTGLGITAKSTFCRLIADLHRHSNEEVIYLDLDHDRDKLPTTFEYRTTYIIEDVHGPTDQAVLPLQNFDQVYYLQPGWLTHLRFWLSRMRIWFKTGCFAWDADQGTNGNWSGTGKTYDLANLLPICQFFLKHFWGRTSIIKQDLQTIHSSGLNCQLVIPQIDGKKIRFLVYDLYWS